MALNKLNAHSRTTFVAPAVKEIQLTKQIIDEIMPFYPKTCRCIAGYLDNTDQYWKINYHWDLLMSKIDAFLAMKTQPATLKAAANAIRGVMMTNPPSPAHGYMNDVRVGMTKDSSPPERIEARWKTLKQSKKDFERVILKAGIIKEADRKGTPSKEDKLWWLAVAPVAPPGDSKHGTGYALDIAGDNVAIQTISEALGASLVFVETSHIHVEFKDTAKLRQRIAQGGPSTVL